MNEVKIAIESIGNRADEMEEKIRVLENRNTEIIQVEEERELRLFFKWRNWRNPMRAMGFSQKGTSKNNWYIKRGREGEGGRDFI